MLSHQSQKGNEKWNSFAWQQDKSLPPLTQLQLLAKPLGSLHRELATVVTGEIAQSLQEALDGDLSQLTSRRHKNGLDFSGLF
mmetsp:Transcript_18361/g.33289  ORF Transcript_18361/g.33289 Transcript_18361/m.33289 type:complete len:83 (+) Transcript_18361:2427-2675(+)